MNVYTCVDFVGRYPIGVAAVIVAESEAAARAELDSWLIDSKLEQPRRFTLQLLDTTKPGVSILASGDY